MSRSEGAPLRDPATQEDNFSVHDSDLGEGEDYTLSHGDHSGTFSTRTLPRQKYTKLETISGQTVRAMMFVHNTALLVGLALCALLAVLCNTVWIIPAEDAKLLGTRRYADLPNWYLILSGILMILTFTYIFLLTIFYWIRIIRKHFTEGGVTLEMIWVMGLTMAFTIYTNPYFAYLALEIGFDLQRLVAAETADTFRNVYLVMSVAFATATMWYIWTTAHSYRYLDTKPGILFYIPKIAIVIGALVVRILAFEQGIMLNEMPLLSGIRLVTFGWQNDSIYDTKFPTIYVLALTGVELIGVSWTLWDIYWTRAFLKKVDYMRFRSKQIGFRFFTYFNGTFYVVYWLVSAIMCTVAAGQLTFTMARWGWWYLGQPEAHLFFGMLLMLCSYLYVTATVNLPAHFKARLFFFACKPCVEGTLVEDGRLDELEPITYRSTEPPSFGQVVEEVQSTVFTMQTHVVMFNFAWLVYYYGTKKFEKLQLRQDVFRFEISEYFTDKPTDTHCIVVDGEDRIIVSFRGTTSGKNLKTDLRISQRPLNSIVPTVQMTHPTQDVTALLSSSKWLQARVHSGFAAAYSSVSQRLIGKVKQLYETKQRPVYLTGHSLGGSLATLCSLDMFVSMGLTNKEIFVSTFGSPRLGNVAFKELYDETVPCNWRIVVGPDMVTKLPRFGYKHCGKKVLLTADGDLFLDPSALELKLWSGEKPGMLYHRKASYLLAMRAWCDINHGEEYVPEFWAWPFTPDDSRRFSHVLNSESSSSSVYSTKRSERKESRGTRLLQRDAMISQLDGAPRSSSQLWADLTRKLLAEDRQRYLNN